MYPDGPNRAEVTTTPNAPPVQTVGRGIGPVPVDHLRLDGVEFRPPGELRLRLTTERSVWLIGADSYYRMPKEEQKRTQDWSIEGRMDDGVWHPYRRAWWWIYQGVWLRGRILPVAGSADGIGIYAGCILAVSGRWEEIEAEPDELAGPDRSQP